MSGKRNKKKTRTPGCRDVPGGYAMPGETALRPLERAVWEECAITVLHARLSQTLIVPGHEQGAPFRYHIFLINSWKGKAYNASPEYTRFRWLTGKQLAERKTALPVYLHLTDSWMNETVHWCYRSSCSEVVYLK